MNRLKEALKRYNLKYLKTEIQTYGFSYSTKDFIVQVAGILGVTFGVAYISMLEWRYILILMSFAFLLTPFLIYTWFQQLYNTKRFTMLTDYLSNIIPIFMQKAKVRFTLNEVETLCTGIMREKVQEALHYIDNNYDDTEVLKHGLEIIEQEFPNSRLKAAHKVMLSVENDNSVTYHEVCENMYLDIENWVKRVYTFQKDLKNRRNKLLLLCAMTLGMNCLFTYLYTGNIYFEGFTARPLYQISTSVFLGAMLMVAVMVITKLHGGWLINDLSNKDETRIAKAYDLIQKGKPKMKPADVVLGTICALGGGYFISFQENLAVGLGLLVMALLLITHNSTKYRNAYRTVNKALTIEFPVWLREVSLSLNNMTVVNAIERSMEMTSYPLTKELHKFMDTVREDPTSIRAFSDFLIDFDLADAQSSMRVLYSIQNLGRKEVKSQVASLILRNQEMLDRAEQIQNEDAIQGVEMLGYVPIVIFSLQMMMSLVILLGHMMDKLSAAINGTGVLPVE